MPCGQFNFPVAFGTETGGAPGNSGGKASIDNIGFAIAINSIMNITTSIIENSPAARPGMNKPTPAVEPGPEYNTPQLRAELLPVKWTVK